MATAITTEHAIVSPIITDSFFSSFSSSEHTSYDRKRTYFFILNNTFIFFCFHNDLAVGFADCDCIFICISHHHAFHDRLTAYIG